MQGLGWKMTRQVAGVRRQAKCAPCARAAPKAGGGVGEEGGGGAGGEEAAARSEEGTRSIGGQEERRRGGQLTSHTCSFHLPASSPSPAPLHFSAPGHGLISPAAAPPPHQVSPSSPPHPCRGSRGEVTAGHGAQNCGIGNGKLPCPAAWTGTARQCLTC